MPIAATNELGRSLLQASVGVESTPNTGVNATTILPVISLDIDPLAPTQIEPAWNAVFGRRGPVTTFATGASWKASMRATTESLGFFLESLFGTVTPGAVGTGYLRTYLSPAATIIAAASRKFLTLYEANTDSVNGYAYRALGAWVKSLRFKTGTNKPLIVDVEGMATRKEASTLAAANTGLSRPTETIWSGNGLAIKSAALGSAPAQFWPNAYEFEMSIDSGRTQNIELGGMEAPSVQPFLEGPWEAIKATLTMARNPTNKAYYDYLVGATPAGATNNLAFEFTYAANKVLTLQMGGAIIAVPRVDRGQNNERLQVTWEGYYSSNLAAPVGVIYSGGPSAIA